MRRGCGHGGRWGPSRFWPAARTEFGGPRPAGPGAAAPELKVEPRLTLGAGRDPEQQRVLQTLRLTPRYALRLRVVSQPAGARGCGYRIAAGRGPAAGVNCGRICRDLCRTARRDRHRRMTRYGSALIAPPAGSWCATVGSEQPMLASGLTCSSGSSGWLQGSGPRSASGSPQINASVCARH